MDDLDLHRANHLFADLGEVEVGEIHNIVGGEGFRDIVDFVGDGFGGGGAVGEVVFDAEVFVGSCRMDVSSEELR